MNFFPPFAASNAIPRRQEHVIQAHPQAASAISTIEDSTLTPSYGASLDQIANHYHFQPRSDVEKFFRAYLKRRYGRVPSDSDVEFHTKRTLNVLTSLDPSSTTRVEREFLRAFEQTLATIQTNSKRHVPTLQFNVGPTGAGKTVFSKFFFTVCMRRFWEHKIIPCRIEYSQFDKHETPDGGVSSQEFYSYVRKCLFRDLIIYLFMSGHLNEDQINRAVVGMHTDGDANRALSKIAQLTKGIILNGTTVTLDANLRDRLAKFIDTIDAKHRDGLLYTFAEEFNLTFLLSFDGFDIVRIEDFLFVNSAAPPVQYLSKLLRGLHEKKGERRLFSRTIDAHYLVYLRDTTFERMRMELFTGIGTEIKLPMYWIAPPKYEMLVDNAANFVTNNRRGQGSAREPLSTRFSEDIFQVFDHHIFSGLDLVARDHLSFLFGSNARRMNQHIRQTLLSMLHRAAQKQAFDFDRYSSGVGLPIIWKQLVEGFGPGQLPRYVLFEDLFLGETRQLQPKLRLDANRISDVLKTGTVRDAMALVTDVDETSSIFGCLLNYALPGFVSDGTRSKEAFLVFVRIIQFVDSNSRCNSGEIFDFLKRVGYKFSQSEFEFCLYILLRTEMIKWDASTSARFISDVPLYATTRGVIGIRKILPSVSYLSEAIISCLHSDRSVTQHFRDRTDESGVWVVDCIFNALVALELFREVESIEVDAAKKSGTSLDGYLLSAILGAAVRGEARAILGNANARLGTRAGKRWETNRIALTQLSKRFPNLSSTGFQHW